MIKQEKNIFFSAFFRLFILRSVKNNRAGGDLYNEA